MNPVSVAAGVKIELENTLRELNDEYADLTARFRKEKVMLMAINYSRPSLGTGTQERTLERLTQELSEKRAEIDQCQALIDDLRKFLDRLQGDSEFAHQTKTQLQVD